MQFDEGFFITRRAWGMYDTEDVTRKTEAIHQQKRREGYEDDRSGSYNKSA
jgi:hypothetical protein